MQDILIDEQKPGIWTLRCPSVSVASTLTLCYMSKLQEWLYMQLTCQTLARQWPHLQCLSGGQGRCWITESMVNDQWQSVSQVKTLASRAQWTTPLNP